MKHLKKPIVKYVVVLSIIVIISLIIEVFIYNGHALKFGKKDFKDYMFTGTDTSVKTQTAEDLVELTAEEIASITVHRENEKLLAEYNGEEYVEAVDETLVETENSMFRKIKNTVLTIPLAENTYIHKISVSCPVEKDSGYQAILYNEDEVVKDNIFCSIDYRIDTGVISINTSADKVQINIMSDAEIAPADIKVEILNEFSFNYLRFLFFIIVFAMAAFFILTKSVFWEKMEYTFAICSLLLGTLLILGIGTNQISYDEHVHALTAYNTSFGATIETTESVMQMAGNNLPAFSNQEERSLVEQYEQVNNDYSWANISNQSRFISYDKRAYIPTAIGLKLGRMLDLPFAWNVMLGKWFNLLFYTILVFLAVKWAKHGKIFVAAFGLIPNNIFLASAFTYDTAVTGFLILAVVLTANEMIANNKKMTWMSTFAILFSYMAGSLSKPIYIIMALMLLFFSSKKFENRIQETVFKSAVVIIAGLMVYTIFKPPVVAGSDFELVGNLAFAGDKRNTGTSVLGQIEYIAGNPLQYTKLLLTSMVTELWSYISGAQQFFTYAYLQGLSKIWTWIGIALFGFMALFAPIGEERVSIGKKYRILNLIMIFGMSAIVWTSMYVSYTAVGSNKILGVQSRYFFPLMIPFFYCLMNARLKCRMVKEYYYKIIFAVIICMNLWATYSLVLKTMNF